MNFDVAATSQIRQKLRIEFVESTTLQLLLRELKK